MTKTFRKAKRMKTEDSKYIFYYENTYAGTLAIAADNTSITMLAFNSDRNSDLEVVETPLIRRAFIQLNEYFAGERQVFDLPLNPQGTEFQKKVWKALQGIPLGETRSYKQIAEAVGNPKACRAVGMANNRNPIAIIIPCHRVVGASGKLVGYAGGLDIKQKLLALENIDYKSII